MKLRGKNKRPSRRYNLKPERVVALLDMHKIKSADNKKPADSNLKLPAPDHLDDIAKAEWKRMVIYLRSIGFKVERYTLALALYCQTYSEWVTSSRELKKPGGALLLKVEGGK